MTAWSWAAASRRGVSHERHGEPRQDAFRIVGEPDGAGALVAVACDGAGSAPRGGVGATIAARVLAGCAQAWLDHAGRLPHPDVMACWMLLARHRIAQAAAAHGLEPCEFATTAVMAMSDASVTVTVHVGDGAVVARDAVTGDWLALSWPEHGEYANTTRFLTDADGPAIRVAVHDGCIDRIAVMTDGLERLALNFAATRVHAAFMEPMAAPLAVNGAAGLDAGLSCALRAYLGSDRVNACTDDDKTLLLACFA
jgi:hypothetical protein